jgi:LysM repeat protein
MVPFFVLLVAVALVIVAGVAAFIVVRRRRARRRAGEAERAELEARVAERVSFLTHPPAFPEESASAPHEMPAAMPTSDVADRQAAPLLTAQPDTEQAAAEPRFIPIPAPADSVIERGRVAQEQPAPFVPEPSPAPPEPPAPVARPVTAALAATPARTSPRRAQAAKAADQPPRRRRRAVLSLVAAAIVVVVLVAVGREALRQPAGAGGTQVPTSSLSAVASPTLAPSPTPSPSPAPSPTAVPTPTGAPTARPPGTATPTPNVYVVRPGDTLTQIASAFGIALKLLEDANPQITDPDVIHAGDHVTIPTPTPAP